METCLGNIILRWTIVKIDINIHISMLEPKILHNYAFVWRTLNEFGMVRTTHTQLDCACPRTEEYITTSLGGDSVYYCHNYSQSQYSRRYQFSKLTSMMNIATVVPFRVILWWYLLNILKNRGTWGGVFGCAVLYCVVCCILVSTAYFVNNEKWEKNWAEIVQMDRHPVMAQVG